MTPDAPPTMMRWRPSSGPRQSHALSVVSPRRSRCRRTPASSSTRARPAGRCSGRSLVTVVCSARMRIRCVRQSRPATIAADYRELVPSQDEDESPFVALLQCEATYYRWQPTALGFTTCPFPGGGAASSARGPEGEAVSRGSDRRKPPVRWLRGLSARPSRDRAMVLCARWLALKPLTEASRLPLRLLRATWALQGVHLCSLSRTIERSIACMRPFAVTTVWTRSERTS